MPGSWICNLNRLILTVAHGSSDLGFDIKTLNLNISLYNQPFQTLKASRCSTLDNLSKAYNNLRNDDVRIFTLSWRQWWFLELLRAIPPNRWRRKYRKVTSMLSLIQCCFYWKKLQSAMVELFMNSHESQVFLLQITKTVEDYSLGKMKQKKFFNLVRNWGSSNEFCSWSFLMNLENWREKLLEILVICDCDYNSVMINVIYLHLIHLLITN